MNALTNNIDQKINNVKRKIFLIHLTNNLGKIVEDEEKITCYVKKSRCKKERYYYTIACRGIDKKNKALTEKYNLNKPICYVIDGLEFEKDKVNIWGYDNCEVIIRNCKFGFDLSMHINGKCTLENTFIRAFGRLWLGATEFIIKNMDIRNHLSGATDLQIELGADEKMEINNSSIGRIKEGTKVFITLPKKLEIYNSKIAGEIVKCESVKIIAGKKSSIEATKKVDLKVKDFYEINITSPTINFNGNTINSDKKDVILKRTTEPIKVKRFELIELLKEIKNECEKTNKEKTEEYHSNLTKQQISKVLKK